MSTSPEYGKSRSSAFMNLRGFESKKPLIRDFFHSANFFFRKDSCRCRSMNRSCDIVSSTGGLSLSVLSVDDGTSLQNPQSDALSQQKFFALTPSVSEPVRIGHSGVLLESESLHVKHKAEYECLVPALGIALKNLIATHEVWRRETEKSNQRRQGEADQDFVKDDLIIGGGSSTVLSTKLESVTRVKSGKASLGNMEHMHFLAFETSVIPDLSLDEYVRRLADHTCVSPSALLVACLYIDRLLTSKGSLTLTLKNVYKFFAIAVRIANKVMDTRTLSNKSFASISGFSNNEMNSLEMRFLCHLDFDLYVSAAEFYEYARDLTSAPVDISPRLSSSAECLADAPRAFGLQLPPVLVTVRGGDGSQAVTPTLSSSGPQGSSCGRLVATATASVQTAAWGESYLPVCKGSLSMKERRRSFTKPGIVDARRSNENSVGRDAHAQSITHSISDRVPPTQKCAARSQKDTKRTTDPHVSGTLLSHTHKKYT